MPVAHVFDQLLWYQDVGSGDAVVALHGAMGTAASHLGGVIDFLSRHYRVIAPDLRGYGRSEPKPRRFGPDFYVQDALDVGALLDELGIDRAHVLGFSDGGEAALLVAIERPDRARSVAAWGVAGAVGSDILAIADEYDSPAAWATSRAAWREQVIALHGQENFEAMAIGWAQAIRGLVAAGGDLSLNQAHEIECPVLLINGEQDKGNPEHLVRQLAGRISQCTLEIWPGLGHPVHTQAPDQFYARLLAFLQSCP